jgi:protein-tyrosine phosphatase
LADHGPIASAVAAPGFDGLVIFNHERGGKGFMPSDMFTILTICTGNVCRSPAAERLLANKLGPTVRVASAGTHALVGEPISQPMAALLRDNRFEPEPFQARRLSEQMLKEADLILPMTRAQRGLVVELWPAAVRRVFTLREFARLLTSVDPSALPAGTPAARLRAAIPLALSERGRVLVPPDRDDVVDPFRLNSAAYANSFDQVVAAVNIIVYTIVTD